MALVNLVEVQHPVLEAHLTKMRDHRTGRPEFARSMSLASSILAYEATKTIEVNNLRVPTPLGESVEGVRLRNNIFAVPILRAGLGMLDGFLTWVPNSTVAQVGIQRGELNDLTGSLGQYKIYTNSLPIMDQSQAVFILDPMLATGKSAIAAIELCKLHGAEEIVMLNILCSPEGLVNVHREEPDVVIYTAKVDKRLDEKYFIRPGLGDAGDRLMGT